MARYFPPRSQRESKSTPTAPIQPPDSRTSALRDPAEIATSHTVVSTAPQPAPSTSAPVFVPPATYLVPPIERVLLDDLRTAPSLPIILISAAVGVAAGVATFFLLWEITALRLAWSVGLSALALFFGVGASGALLSAVTSSRAAVQNILFSCGTILLLFLFFGVCMLVGALGATFLLFLQA